jgi:hypothetical protein
MLFGYPGSGTSYTDKQRVDFIVQYNHNQELRIEETNEALYALEVNEIMIDGKPQVDEEYEAKQEQARREQFNKDFFQTSLGYIRRKVSMATGETKDFLSDLLPTISMGVQMGQPVTIIAYAEPDFTTDIIDWEALQTIATVDAQFVQECFMQLSNDFKPVIPETDTDTDIDTDTDTEVI